MPLIEIGQLLLLTAAVAFLMVLLLWLLSMLLRDVSIIDMAFSGIIALLLLVAYWQANAAGVIPRLLILLMLVWPIRMSVYLIWRNWGHGEDPRYTRLRDWVPAGWQFH